MSVFKFDFVISESERQPKLFCDWENGTTKGWVREKLLYVLWREKAALPDDEAQLDKMIQVVERDAPYDGVVAYSVFVSTCGRGKNE